MMKKILWSQLHHSTSYQIIQYCFCRSLHNNYVFKHFILFHSLNTCLSLSFLLNYANKVILWYTIQNALRRSISKVFVWLIRAIINFIGSRSPTGTAATKAVEFSLKGELTKEWSSQTFRSAHFLYKAILPMPKSGDLESHAPFEGILKVKRNFAIVSERTMFEGSLGRVGGG